jgi:hypothetical protein
MENTAGRSPTERDTPLDDSVRSSPFEFAQTATAGHIIIKVGSAIEVKPRRLGSARLVGTSLKLGQVSIRTGITEDPGAS